MSRYSVALLLLALAVSVRAGENSGSVLHRITFLHLTKIGQHVTLDSVTTVQGQLKVPKHLTLRPGDLSVRVTSLQGEELYRTALADPSVRRLEYADSTGQLATQVQILDSVRFTLRLPYDAAQHAVNFRRVNDVDSAGAARGAETDLGSVVIPRKEQDHD